MTDGVTIKVRRKDELLKKFRRMAPAADAELEKANRRSADEMVGLARSFAPKESGELAESIQATPPGRRPPGKVAKVVPAGAYAVTAGDERVRYAHLVEYGTAAHANRGQFAGTTHPGTGRQPFFWPAYRLIRKRHRGRIGRALRAAIKKAMR